MFPKSHNYVQKGYQKSNSKMTSSQVFKFQNLAGRCNRIIFYLGMFGAVSSFVGKKKTFNKFFCNGQCSLLRVDSYSQPNQAVSWTVNTTPADILQVKGELRTWFDQLEFYFVFFPIIEKYTLVFAMRAKVEQKGRVIFLYWKKIKNKFQHVKVGAHILGVMKRSVKTDVDSRRPRSTVDQTELFYWSTLTRLRFSTGQCRQINRERENQLYMHLPK